MEDKDKLFLIQLSGLLIIALCLTIMRLWFQDETLNGFAYMAWGGLLTMLRPQKLT